MLPGPPPADGTLYSVIVPTVLIRPILPPAYSANQSAPSGPAAIPTGLLLEVGIGYSVTTPALLSRPILLVANSVNQIAPSGPAVRRKTSAPGIARGYSV